MQLQRFAALGAATLAVIGLTLGAAAPALAHDELVDSGLEFDPAGGELQAITLAFNNDIMDVGTEIIVTDQAGANVASAEPELAGRNVRQALDAPLAPGVYATVWRVVSSDGHPIQGSFGIEVAPDGSAEMTAAPEAEQDPGTDDGTDESAEESTDEGLTTTSSAATREDASFPMGGWIALAAVLLVGIGSAGYLASRSRRKAAEASSTAERTAESTDAAAIEAANHSQANDSEAVN